MSDRVIRVPESAQVVRSPGGSPATVRQTVDRVRVVTAGIPGPVGRSGPPGLPGTAANSYTHQQAIPALVWTINHNLGFYPTIQTFTTGGVEVDGGVIHLSPNTTQVTFSGPLAGSARAV
jgi:hypothetical protein